MTTRPMFGMSCCTRQIGDETAQAVMSRYVSAAMRHADADAVLIPAMSDLSDARNLMRRLDGILLTGSPTNVEPRRYGAEGGAGPFDTARDAAVLALIEAATAEGRPVFGICRGLQEINVAFGGTLRADLGHGADLPHHAPDEAGLVQMFEHRHDVALVSNRVLAHAIGRECIAVNSVHYQGIDRLAHDLIAEAHASDGVVEAFSAKVGASMIAAVQWHPEWDADRNDDSRAFFDLFGQALRGATAAGLSS